MHSEVSICIPRIGCFSSKRDIHTVLEKYNLGSISRIDIVGHKNSRRAFIHFDHWNKESPIARTILNRLNNREKVNIIHSFPWYWRCVKSRLKIPDLANNN
jgi:hypothetical protein